MKQVISGSALMAAITLLCACAPANDAAPIERPYSPKPDSAPASTAGPREALTAASGMPDQLRSFAAEGEIVIGQKVFDVTGDGILDAVVIVRRPVSSLKGPEDNPCELRILRGVEDSYELMSKSEKVVDCINDNFARVIASNPDDLDQYLDVAPLAIKYRNVKAIGENEYSFKFSTAKDDWFVSSVRISYPQPSEKSGSVAVVTEQVTSPRDFGETPMSSFDPSRLSDVLGHNKTIVE